MSLQSNLAAAGEAMEKLQRETNIHAICNGSKHVVQLYGGITRGNWLCSLV